MRLLPGSRRVRVALAVAVTLLVAVWAWSYRPWQAHYPGRPTSWWSHSPSC